MQWKRIWGGDFEFLKQQRDGGCHPEVLAKRLMDNIKDAVGDSLKKGKRTLTPLVKEFVLLAFYYFCPYFFNRRNTYGVAPRSICFHRQSGWRHRV